MICTPIERKERNNAAVCRMVIHFAYPSRVFTCDVPFQNTKQKRTLLFEDGKKNCCILRGNTRDGRETSSIFLACFGTCNDEALVCNWAVGTLKRSGMHVPRYETPLSETAGSLTR
ncbi:unnamed protein product [Ixodes pacificus]